MTGLVDAHVHLWNRATDPQPWIDPRSMAAIDRDFGSGDLAEMLDATGIDRAVLVQASNSLAETRRLLGEPGDRTAGVVGWIDLTADVHAQLDLLRAGGRRPLVGIRHLVHLDPDPDWLGRPDVGRALATLGAHDLCFDLVIRPWQLPLAASVAGEHPELRFVLDHLGGAADSTDLPRWEDGLRAVAAHPHVYAKISGLAGLVGDPGRLRWMVGVAVEAFGPDRLMYGSDWPVARLGAGPVAWRAAVDDLLGDLSAPQCRAILSATATSCYRLDR
ncbi:amidohydrolase [Actinoplanes philippinensis]|uniref:L-fuconolactonase n=1 Tax=Actinoplanes philippinensis TaxID=35752 RepID=A0A1I2E7A6_9ACTN|nr:amidohydrolase family protein [Actinoplanes philippinensis]GIE77229.1 amidohydrolase [Actinoplanes philippinensis]SFE88509.1 L-fuconolactonase [Actinoplanes philippinensis]